jgi:hypothetical protein
MSDRSSPRGRLLRFAVTGALLVPGLALSPGCSSDEKATSNPGPEEEEVHTNPGPEEDTAESKSE